MVKYINLLTPWSLLDVNTCDTDNHLCHNPHLEKPQQPSRKTNTLANNHPTQRLCQQSGHSTEANPETGPMLLNTVLHLLLVKLNRLGIKPFFFQIK